MCVCVWIEVSVGGWNCVDGCGSECMELCVGMGEGLGGVLCVCVCVDIGVSGCDLMKLWVGMG